MNSKEQTMKMLKGLCHTNFLDRAPQNLCTFSGRTSCVDCIFSYVHGETHTSTEMRKHMELLNEDSEGTT